MTDVDAHMPKPPALYSPTKRGWLYHCGSHAEVFRLNPFLKPHTAKNRGWATCPVYVNCYPDENHVSTKLARSSEQRQLFLKGGVASVAGSTALDPENGHLSEFLRNTFPEFFPSGLASRGISDVQWESFLLITNGAAVTRIRDAFGAFDLRACYAQIAGGVTGAKYPSSKEIRAQFARTVRLKDVASNYPRLARINVASVIPRIDGHVSASPAVAGPTTPLPPVVVLDDPPSLVEFDADSMTHRQIIDLARKGHDAAALVADRDRAVSAAVDLATTATAERDEAIAERDAAEKRAAMVAPVSSPITDNGDGTVEVLGVKLPTWSGGHGPAAKAGYDLTAWQAVLTVADFEVRANAAQVAKTIYGGEKVRLVGPPAVGKTSGISEICSATGAKFWLIPCGEGATDLSLIAERTIGKDKSFQWTDGHVTAAIRWAIANPDSMVVAVLDESDHLDAGVQSLLHSVLEGGTLVVNPEETLVVPPNIRWVATANTSGFGDTTGRHSAAKVSDTAFTSRWNATFTVAYLPPDAECRVLVSAGADPDIAAKAVAVANSTRGDQSPVSQPIVLRQLLAWARSCHAGNEPKWAWGWTVLGSMPEHDRLACRELTSHHLGW